MDIDTPTGITIDSNTDLAMPNFDRFVHTTIPLKSSHISISVQHVLAVSGNKPFACGSNDEKQLGIDGESSGSRMAAVTEFSVGEVLIIKIGTSDTCSFVLLEDRTLWGFGTLRVSCISF